MHSIRISAICLYLAFYLLPTIDFTQNFMLKMCIWMHTFIPRGKWK